jgi:hypothetical protein
MRTQTSGLLAVLCAGLLTASVAQAWPEGRSFILFDGDGFELECIDVAYAGEEVHLYWTDMPTALLITQDHPAVGRTAMTFRVPNHEFGGLYMAANTFVDCMCSRFGQPRFQVAGFAAGKGSCSCTATYRGLHLGKSAKTEPLIGVELGGGARCEAAYVKPVLRPRLQDRWNQDSPSR